MFPPRGLGWNPDLPDPRDYTPQHEAVVDALRGLEARGPRPDRVDWREYYPPIRDQGDLAAGAAYASTTLLEYFELRAHGRVLGSSRMFVHQAARRLMNWTGNSGAPFRPTLKAIARFGIPAEEYWSNEPAPLAEEPGAFVYAAAERFPSLAYLRLDGRGKRGKAVLGAVRSFLAAGFGCVFGFPVSTSLSHEGEIPYPTRFDRIRGGHAVVAAGYDDTRRIRSDRGALLIANSWGTAWGENGYGWLPYSYVQEQLAVDFWTLLRPQWLASGEFSRPV